MLNSIPRGASVARRPCGDNRTPELPALEVGLLRLTLRWRAARRRRVAPAARRGEGRVAPAATRLFH